MRKIVHLVHLFQRIAHNFHRGLAWGVFCRKTNILVVYDNFYHENNHEQDLNKTW